MKKKQTPKQILSNLLRRNQYRGLYGQISYHGVGEYSIQIFAENTLGNSAKFIDAMLNAQGSLCVLDISL